MKNRFWILKTAFCVLSVMALVVVVDIFFKKSEKVGSFGFGGNPFASDTLSYRFPALSDFHSLHFGAPAALSMNEDGFVYSLTYLPNESSKIK